MVLTDGFEELDAVLPGHIVVRNDAIETLLRESVQRVTRTGGRFDGEPVEFPLENICYEFSEIRLVVNMKDSYRLINGRGHDW